MMKKQLVLIFAVLLFGRAHANIVGNGFQNFNTIPSGIDFVTVHSSETLRPGLINIGLFVNQAFNSLPYFQGGAQGRTEFNDSILGMDANIGVGLGPNWDAGISFPWVLHQSVDNAAQFHGEWKQTGNLEVRVQSKYRFWGDASGGFAVIGSVVFDRTENNPYAGVDSGPTYNLELAWDTTINKWAIGVNGGYRFADPGPRVSTFPIDPVDDQWIASVAASYLLSSVDTKLIFEIFGATPVERKASNPDRLASSLELIGGVKHDVNHNLALHTGLGTELVHGVSSPDWRWYAGLNYSFGPTFGSRHDDPDESSDRLVLTNVHFEFDSDQMTPESEERLDKIIATLKRRSFRRLRVEGHTDSIGPEEYNLKLSQRRAETIKNFLVRRGRMDAKRIVAIGKGESEPIADNGNFQGRQENRRVEFIFER